MRKLMTNRIQACAQFLGETMDAEADAVDRLDGDWLTEMVNESAQRAGFSDQEIEAGWDLLNEREGA